MPVRSCIERTAQLLALCAAERRSTEPLAFGAGPLKTSLDPLAKPVAFRPGERVDHREQNAARPLIVCAEVLFGEAVKVNAMLQETLYCRRRSRPCVSD
jgi:hypothetical protein